MIAKSSGSVRSISNASGCPSNSSPQATGSAGGGPPRRLEAAAVPQLRQSGAYLLYAGPQLRAGEQHLRAAVGQAVADGVGAEGGVEGADEGAELWGPNTAKDSSGERSR